MKSKRLKKRITAFSATVLVIALIVAINIGAAIAAEKTDFTIDLTKDRVLEFSPLTEEVIKNIDDEINIISIIPEEFNDSYGVMSSLRMILKKYDTSSDKIKYTVVDTAQDPTFAQKYKLSNGDAVSGDYYLFIENSSDYRVVDLNDMVTLGESNTYLAAEQKITSAIENLTFGGSIKVYYTEAHGERMSLYNSGEFLIGDYLTKIFADEYFEFEELNLLSGNDIEENSVIMCVAPQEDFSEEEIAQLDLYLQNGANMIFMPDPQLGTEIFGNILSYFEGYGLGYENAIVADEKSDNYFGQNPYYVMADKAELAKTAKLSTDSSHIAMPLSLSVKTMGDSAKPLLTTSEKGFCTSADTSDEKNGVFNLAAANIKNGGGSIMLFGTKDVLSAYYMDGSGFANKDFIKNSVKYLAGNGGIISIGPKDLSPVYLDIPSSQVKLIIAITVVVFPFIILTAGFIVWRKRNSL